MVNLKVLSPHLPYESCLNINSVSSLLILYFVYTQFVDVHTLYTMLLYLRSVQHSVYIT